MRRVSRQHNEPDYYPPAIKLTSNDSLVLLVRADPMPIDGSIFEQADSSIVKRNANAPNFCSNRFEMQRGMTWISQPKTICFSRRVFNFGRKLFEGLFKLLGSERFHNSSGSSSAT